MVSIRQAGVGDAETVALLVSRLLSTLRGAAVDPGPYEDTARTWLSRPERFVTFLAEKGPEGGRGAVAVLCLATSVSIYAGGAFGVITELYVEPEQRSTGIGVRLLQRACEFGRERGWDRVEVGAPNAVTWERTVSFYRRNGFNEIGPRLVTML